MSTILERIELLITLCDEYNDNSDLSDKSAFNVAIMTLNNMTYDLRNGLTTPDLERDRLLFVACSLEFCGVLGALDVV